MDESDAACEPVLRKAYAAFHAGVHDGAPPGRAFKVIAATNWKGLVPEDFPLDAWVHLYQEYDDAAAKAWLHSGPSKESCRLLESCPETTVSTSVMPEGCRSNREGL